MGRVLYQHSILGTLMAGSLEGTATIDESLKHGDSGLATLTGSDGEVIFINGEAYHTNEKKEFVKLKGDELTPFVTITKLEADESYETSGKDSETVLNEVKEHMLNDNLFSAVKITGKFKKMHARMMPKQEPPYTRLIDSAHRQPEETQEDANGTAIDFFTPELFHGIGSGSFHIHFANDDHNLDGHILDFEVNDARVKVQNSETFEQHFPIDNKTFTNTEIDYADIDAEIREAE